MVWFINNQSGLSGQCLFVYFTSDYHFKYPPLFKLSTKAEPFGCGHSKLVTTKIKLVYNSFVLPVFVIIKPIGVGHCFDVSTVSQQTQQSHHGTNKTNINVGTSNTCLSLQNIVWSPTCQLTFLFYSQKKVGDWFFLGIPRKISDIFNTPE